MKILIRDDMLQPIEAMAKLRLKAANSSRVDVFDVKGLDPKVTKDFWVYFSDRQAGHGPRIKFYGGTAQTRDTMRGPSLAFGTDGPTQLELESWQDNKAAPLAFNDDVVAYLERFINKFLAGLLLVDFRKLDQSILLNYMLGAEHWEDILEEVQLSDEVLRAELMGCKNFSDLHLFCMNHQLYKF
jgi:hypothetical protein